MPPLFIGEIMTKTARYSEIFVSPQGEGKYTGVPTVWLRLAGCNLTCAGFGQADPADPSTHRKPIVIGDVANMIDVKELPVFDVGCDSAYSWDNQYKHMWHTGTGEEIAEKMFTAAEEFSGGLPFHVPGFFHPWSLQPFHIAFTGGEPLRHQQVIVDILAAFAKRGYTAINVTIETNGTYKLTEPLIEALKNTYSVLISCSPKLQHVTGELPAVAIKPEVIAQYCDLSFDVIIKAVVNAKEKTWEQYIELASTLQYVHNVAPQLWVMPVGGTAEGLTDTKEIAMRAMKHGMYVSGRLQIQLFGNEVGY